MIRSRTTKDRLGNTILVGDEVYYAVAGIVKVGTILSFMGRIVIIRKDKGTWPIERFNNTIIKREQHNREDA